MLDYIHNNLDGDLSLDTLAEVAAMSRFHWHRVFTAHQGETVAQAIRRIRLNRAACWLLETDRALADIAAACGYPNVQSFTRVFGAAFGLPPAAFRERGAMASAPMAAQEGESAMFPVEITEHPVRNLVALPHRGPYIEIGKTFEAVSAIATSRGLWPHVQGMVGVYYDDPDAVPEADLRSHAGLSLAGEMDVPEDLDYIELAGGRMAVLHYKGPYAGLSAAYRYFYGDWLADSKVELRDHPPFEVYLNSPMEVAPQDLLTDICVPVA